MMSLTNRHVSRDLSHNNHSGCCIASLLRPFAEERVGGGRYCIRRVLGRHLAWYWSRNARILARRARTDTPAHTCARAHALEGGHARVVGSRFLSLEVRGGGDCLENGDVGSHRLSSIVNIEESLAKVRACVFVCVHAYVPARMRGNRKRNSYLTPPRGCIRQHSWILSSMA